MAAYYYSKGMNLYDALIALYDRYGYFIEDVRSISLEGRDGLEGTAGIMDYFRTNILDTIGDRKVLFIEDYKTRRRIYLDDSKDEERIGLPSANVVKFVLEGEGWVCLRPSGTEPKLKIYGGFKGNTLEEGREVLKRAITWMEEKINEIGLGG